jgi:SpoVK/Ycf46/Vps4 family AAA+-type ATPase
MRWLLREAMLHGAAVQIDADSHVDGPDTKRDARYAALERTLNDTKAIIFLTGATRWPLSEDAKRWRLYAQAFPVPKYSDRKRLWKKQLNGHSSLDPLIAGDFAGRFRFSEHEVLNAMRAAGNKAVMRGRANTEITREDLEWACREESSPGLVSFAHPVQSNYTWDDLVLPADQRRQLREAVDHIRHHERVYAEWGFGKKHWLGRGVNILFSGASGTGKTMAAGIIAREIGLDLYKIDLSMVVSKYIGETEKNLNRIFAEAQTGSAMLFFDEADALFGKRSEVKDSHDRYANIEINYLLQKMEEHEGVIILASNLSKNLDEAFTRRLQFTIVFPLPEREERLTLWRQVFPEETPLAVDVDLEFLARRIKMTGGNIKNIAVGAAMVARSEDSDVQMKHVVLATKREFQKVGKIPQKSDFGDYYELIAGV